MSAGFSSAAKFLGPRPVGLRGRNDNEVPVSSDPLELIFAESIVPHIGSLERLDLPRVLSTIQRRVPVSLQAVMAERTLRTLGSELGLPIANRARATFAPVLS